MLERHVAIVIGYISERAPGSEYDIFSLELSLSQLRVFLFVDELTFTKIKPDLRDIRSA